MTTTDKIEMPKITANNSKEFSEIEEKLRKLPLSTLEQISHAEYGGVGLECEINTMYKSDIKVCIPKSLVTQISDFGDYIGVYCMDYFLKIQKPVDGKPITYLFVD